LNWPTPYEKTIRGTGNFVLAMKIQICHACRVRSAPHVIASNGGQQFATIPWSLILTQRVLDQQASAPDELALLSQIYWRPIFAFICRSDYPAQDAQDLAQDFFVMILEGKLFASENPKRGCSQTVSLASGNAGRTLWRKVSAMAKPGSQEITASPRPVGFVVLTLQR
jgi:hypothetical protein